MSGLKFGTSGLRGLVRELAGAPARQWTRAFLTYLERDGTRQERTLLVGRDLRASSPGIAGDCIQAAASCGWNALDCGALPTPALAVEAIRRRLPAMMVTGSHIPDDRNGLKFYSPAGEITKEDENRIQLAHATVSGAETSAPPRTERIADSVRRAYEQRYVDFFPPHALAGLTIGVYQHSSVARDLLVGILSRLGAKTVALGRSEAFVPVDTEAHRPEDIRLLQDWCQSGSFDAIVSTDGDADRPFVADAAGQIVRGDILGLLSAAYLGLRTIVTPVTSSAAVETSGIATDVRRTRVGSPFVIAGIAQATAEGAHDIIGFEANGGVLIGTPVTLSGRTLAALPTRDAMVAIICALAAARAQELPLAQLVARVGGGFALADRLKDIPSTDSAPLLRQLATDAAFAARFFQDVGAIASCSDLDGVRFVLDDASVVHFRTSGNAPEFRCYVEASQQARAQTLLEWAMAKAGRAMDGTR